MQKVKLKYFGMLLLILINAYCLTGIFTGGAYCRPIRVNISNSLPYYLFTTSSIGSIERNMFVSLSHSFSELDLFKQVVGLPGDKIDIHDQHIFINGQDYGEIQTISPSGFLLSPIEERVIPEGYLFVHATHPLSFDSRYGEFGLVLKKQLKEKLCPIF